MLRLLSVSASLLIAIASPGNQTSVQRADALVADIKAALERPVTDEGRRVAAEKLAELDTLGPEVLTQKCAGYNRLVSLNRGSKDPDEKLLRRFLALYDRLPQTERKPFRFGRYLAYEILANQAHRQNDFDREKGLLREALRLFNADPEHAREQQITQRLLDRAELVGRAAPALVADHWFNAAPAGNRLEMGGDITVIEFTAHWCSPCRESYPALLRLQTRFADRGVRVVLATRLWGYFGKERDIDADRELAADRKLLLEEDKLPFPVAIATPAAGAGPAAAADANAKAYFVQPIPQFVVVDRQGLVRRIDLGWEAEDEASLVAFIEQLLAENPTAEFPDA